MWERLWDKISPINDWLFSLQCYISAGLGCIKSPEKVRKYKESDILKLPYLFILIYLLTES